MANRSLSPKTKQLLKDWYLDNLSEHGKLELIGSLIGELSETKQRQIDKIADEYYQG